MEACFEAGDPASMTATEVIIPPWSVQRPGCPSLWLHSGKELSGDERIMNGGERNRG